MTFRFEAVPADRSAVGALAALAPTNPFATPAFVAAQRALGRDAVVLTLRDGERTVFACAALLTGRAPARLLSIPSAPGFRSTDEARCFTEGIESIVRASHVCEAEIGSFASPESAAPLFAGRGVHRARVEYLLDLERPVRLSSNHRRNAVRARRSGVTVRRGTDHGALAAHLRLMAQSMERRDARGESVPVVAEDREARALLQLGAAELFQAMNGDVPLSSVLVLRSATGAYYHSAGTSPHGMELGASPLLLGEIAASLASEGATVFNLGGAGDESPGLQRFKAGFGARTVSLDAVTVTFGSGAERYVRRGVSRVLRLFSPAGGHG